MSLHIIALTDYNANKGKAPPTMRKLAKMAEKKSIPFFPVQVEHAYVVDKDLMGSELTIHNYDGKGTKINVFATTPQLTESANTAISKPKIMQSDGTRISHIKLFLIASLN